jgi:hypothetical protein
MPSNSLGSDYETYLVSSEFLQGSFDACWLTHPREGESDRLGCFESFDKKQGRMEW